MSTSSQQLTHQGWDKIIFKHFEMTGRHMPKASLYDASWSKIMARHQEMVAGVASNTISPTSEAADVSSPTPQTLAMVAEEALENIESYADSKDLPETASIAESDQYDKAWDRVMCKSMCKNTCQEPKSTCKESCKEPRKEPLDADKVALLAQLSWWTHIFAFFISLVNTGQPPSNTNAGARTIQLQYTEAKQLECSHHLHVEQASARIQKERVQQERVALGIVMCLGVLGKALCQEEGGEMSIPPEVLCAILACIGLQSRGRLRIQLGHEGDEGLCGDRMNCSRARDSPPLLQRGSLWGVPPIQPGSLFRILSS